MCGRYSRVSISACPRQSSGGEAGRVHTAAAVAFVDPRPCGRITSRSESRPPARGGLMVPAETFSASIFFNSTPRRYAFALAATLFALLIAAATRPLAGGDVVYLVLAAAVAFSAA